MRSSLIALTAGASLLLSGCPQIAGDAVPAHLQAAPGAAAHRAQGAQHVKEIAWFQGNLDEAFSHRGCPERHPRRTLFRF